MGVGEGDERFWVCSGVCGAGKPYSRVSPDLVRSTTVDEREFCQKRTTKYSIIFLHLLQAKVTVIVRHDVMLFCVSLCHDLGH